MSVQALGSQAIRFRGPDRMRCPATTFNVAATSEPTNDVAAARERGDEHAGDAESSQLEVGRDVGRQRGRHMLEEA